MTVFVAILCTVVFLALFIGMLIIGQFNDLQTKKADVMKSLADVKSAYGTRRRRVNKDVWRYSKLASRHEQKAIRSASNRGRG